MESEDNNNTFCVENENFLLFNKCRLCLDEEAFLVVSDSNNLSNNIYTYMGIMIQESNDLPNKLCKSCFKIVDDFVHLTLKATKNEEYLKTVFGGNSTKEESTVDSTSSIAEDSEDLISNINCSQKSHVTFLTIRRDLYESSSIITKEEGKEGLIKPLAQIEHELKCHVCSKIFKTRKQHMLHQRSHNKKFSCPINICAKKFATKGDLEKHVRSHTGERPFQCDECNKSFTQRVSLKAHKINVHIMAT